MWAAGAMPCTDSTSRVSSPYQPCGSCFWPFSGWWYVPGATTWVMFVDAMLRIADHWSRSVWIVGEAYASMIATVWPAPLRLLEPKP